jgi:hypothetical protein
MNINGQNGLACLTKVWGLLKAAARACCHGDVQMPPVCLSPAHVISTISAAAAGPRRPRKGGGCHPRRPAPTSLRRQRPRGGPLKRLRPGTLCALCALCCAVLCGAAAWAAADWTGKCSVP